MDHKRKILVEMMKARVSESGIFSTKAAGVSLIRSDEITALAPVIYQAVLYIVIQGQKTSYLGEEAYRYDPMNFLASSVPLPMEGHVTQASQTEPYLAIRIDIDVEMIRSLLRDLPNISPAGQSARGVCISPMSDELNSVIPRLLDNVYDPYKAAVLVPMAIKEALFYVLQSTQGAQLAAFSSQGRHQHQISKVIQHIQTHFKEALDIDCLAEIANMSPSSLHFHFKSVTNSSPIQYIKAVRLHQAHHMVTLEHTSISEAAFKVGYQNLSQFSREYKRFFGEIPSRSRIVN